LRCKTNSKQNYNTKEPRGIRKAEKEKQKKYISRTAFVVYGIVQHAVVLENKKMCEKTKQKKQKTITYGILYLGGHQRECEKHDNC
jgi:hypothetical protein